MQKPFSIQVNDLKSKIVEDINASRVPLMVVTQVLNAIAQECVRTQQAEEQKYYDELGGSDNECE